MKLNILNLLHIFIIIINLINCVICYYNNGHYYNKAYNYNYNHYRSDNNYYCDYELCGGQKHVACNNTGSLSVYCSPDARVIDLKPYKYQIVHLHNKYRNLIALGYVPEYKPAAKMATMFWDDELAKLAELNVKKCVFEHDKCYNTKRFRNAGQCLAGIYYYPPEGLDVSQRVEQAIDIWFNEYRVIDSSYVENFRVEHHFNFYGHFLEFVVDRNTHVGCAAIDLTDYKHPQFKRINIACNYASIFSDEYPVYESGIPTSKCKTGRNPRYLGLCSEKERINPNYHNELYY